MVTQVIDQSPRNVYVASGGQTIFPYSFLIFLKTDITVEQNGATLVVDVDFTVSAVGNINGGNVTLTVGATNNDSITIFRSQNFDREVDYQESGDFLSETVNGDFNRMILMLQQNREELTRTLQYGIDDTISGRTIPALDARIGKLLGFDSSGDVNVQSVTDTNVSSDADIAAAVDNFLNRTRHELGSIAAASSHAGISAGHIIETSYRDGNRILGSGSLVSHTGITIPGKAGQWLGTASDGYGYDVDGLQFDYADSPVNPLVYGLHAGSADNTSAWQSLLARSPAHVHFSKAGTYIFLSATTHSADISITSASGVVIDCTDAGYTGAWWTKFLGSIAQIEELGANAVKGERTLTFASAPSLSIGDEFIIFNPTNSSWSGFRTNYHAGEFCKVVNVTGSTVRVASELYDDYVVAAVDVYKVTGVQVNLDDIEVNGDKSSGLINLEFCTNSVISSPRSHHKNNSCILLQRCFDININNPMLHNEGDGGDDYGISIANSQTVKTSGGNVYSRRHAVTTGGDAEVGAVPCRDIRTKHATLSNDVSAATHCADFHGNTEDSTYEDCEIYGGATWQGKDNGYVNCRIGSLSIGVCIISAEILGGTHYARGCKLHTVVNPQTASRGVVDIGGNTSVVTSDTVEDCVFELTKSTLRGRNFSATTSIMLMKNRGATVNTNINIDDLVLDVDDLGQVLFTESISGTPNADFIIIDHIVSPLTGKILHNPTGADYTAFPHRCQRQSGQETLTTGTGSPTVTGTAVTFKWSYPRIPDITMGRANLGYAGNRIGIPYATPLTISAITPVISTDDATNFSSAQDVDIGWRVGLEEV